MSPCITHTFLPSNLEVIRSGLTPSPALLAGGGEKGAWVATRRWFEIGAERFSSRSGGGVPGYQGGFGCRVIRHGA